MAVYEICYDFASKTLIIYHFSVKGPRSRGGGADGGAAPNNFSVIDWRLIKNAE